MFALLFLQASIASLLTGTAAWLMLKLAARAWPGLEARRAPWLLAALAIAASMGLTLLPATSRLSIVPAIELSAAAPAPAAHRPDNNADASDDLSLPARRPAPLLDWFGRLWLAVYAAGLLAGAVRWLRARRHLAALLRASRRLDRFDLASHPGFHGMHGAALQVREVDAPISPMLAGLLRPILLLPRHLRDFESSQQRLVIEHELTHLARRDQLWLHLGVMLQAVLWFNPAVSRLRRQLAWAQELGCDRAVMEGRPSAQRRSYAAALVAQLRLQVAPDQLTAVTFGGRVFDSVSARIGMIRDGVPAMPRAVVGAVSWAALPALLLATVLLQPALAWHVDAAPASLPAIAAPAAAEHWQAPMTHLRVSSFFGVDHLKRGRPHAGMDFAAPTGTPVTASSDGVVVESTNRYRGEAKYGEVIVIEHANGLRSVYAHLHRRRVQPGEHVAAGQLIGISGGTGEVTGPHLHFEALRDGVNIDPQDLLGNLEANATKTALRALQDSRQN